jgi:hypothetical protein
MMFFNLTRSDNSRSGSDADLHQDIIRRASGQLGSLQPRTPVELAAAPSHNNRIAGGIMTKRVFLAGLLGGVAMFAWTSLAHMVLPLGDAGIKEIPNEQGVLSAMHSSLGEASGLYFFPGMGLGPDATMQQKRAVMDQYGQKLAVNPSGILIYHPAGAKPITTGQLTTEFFTELIESLLVVFLLAQTRLASFASRLGFVIVAGVLATIATNVSYWNWYGFPATYTAAYMTTGLVGFLCAGLVAAAVMKPQIPTALATAV